MANTVISLRSSGVSGNTPSTSLLANGELSLNFADGILYYKTAAGLLGSIYTAQPSGLDTEVQFNDSGSFGGSSKLTFNKVTGLLKSNVLVSNSYIQFGDGTKQYTANAGSGGGGGSTDWGFGVIYTSNNSAYANAASANAQVNFVGVSGTVVLANSDTNTITFAGTPGLQGLSVDYGYVYESLEYSIDYGTL